MQSKPSKTPFRARIALAALLLPTLATASGGRMEVSWDPVPGAAGYRVYVGSQPGTYNQVYAVGPATRALLEDLPDCQTSYVAVKAYNTAGESPDYSNEVSGWPQPNAADDSVPQVVQGGQFTVDLDGGSFIPGTELVFEATDIDGNPLVVAESVVVPACDRIQALLTVEPLVPGFRAMEVGEHEFRIIGPDGVVGSGRLQVDMRLERLDINRSDDSTRDRVDGKDLVWLAFAHGTGEGEERFNPDADLNGDGTVDGEDLAQLAAGFGACWTGTGWDSAACPTH